jgi:hypothetical protein
MIHQEIIEWLNQNELLAVFARIPTYKKYKNQVPFDNLVITKNRILYNYYTTPQYYSQCYEVIHSNDTITENNEVLDLPQNTNIIICNSKLKIRDYYDELTKDYDEVAEYPGKHLKLIRIVQKYDDEEYSDYEIEKDENGNNVYETDDEDVDINDIPREDEIGEYDYLEIFQEKFKNHYSSCGSYSNLLLDIRNYAIEQIKN